MAMILRTRYRKYVRSVRFAMFIGAALVYFFSTSTSQKLKTEVKDETNVFNNRHLLAVPNNTSTSCIPPAVGEFPSDGFTRSERKHGWIALHIIGSFYCFMLLASVCDDFFVPSVKKLCRKLRLSDDVAGATFMAIASSSPELFINSVGTFVTEGDIGLGTIVGSAVFNLLFVPACCGLIANSVLQLELWPITRDSLMYALSVIALFLALRDGKIDFYEATVLLSAYFIYILVMVFNVPIINSFTRLSRVFRRKKKYVEIANETHPLLWVNGKISVASSPERDPSFDSDITLKDCEDLEESTKIWSWPSNYSITGQIWWVIAWPVIFLLGISIPDCRKHPRVYVITFFMCVVWIGSASYTAAWLITVIGDTLNIPDSVMGLTFLAAGTSVPEAVASVIVVNQGYGAMGLSSVIGSNTFDILICLGLPWMIKTWQKSTAGAKNYITIRSSGLPYTVISLLSTLVLLYFTLVVNKLRLDWKCGLVFLFLYLLFLFFACLVELNVFFDVNLPTCPH